MRLSSILYAGIRFICKGRLYGLDLSSPHFYHPNKLADFMNQTPAICLYRNPTPALIKPLRKSSPYYMHLQIKNPLLVNKIFIKSSKCGFDKSNPYRNPTPALIKPLQFRFL
jgi:hypothetical protein